MTVTLFANVIDLKSCLIRMGPNMTGVLLRREETDKRTYKGGTLCDCGGREWSIVAARIASKAPEARECKRGFPPTDFRRIIVLLTLGFQLRSLYICRRIHSSCFKPFRRWVWDCDLKERRNLEWQTKGIVWWRKPHEQGQEWVDGSVRRLEWDQCKIHWPSN